MKKYTVNTDCLNFPLDRPCSYQKNNRILCEKCDCYRKISKSQEQKRILIIKLGAMGDVLRTTFLLWGLKELYPKSIISWIVDNNNADVLKHNTLIDNIITNDENISKFLINNFFDMVISLDLAFESLFLAKLSNKSEVIGFTLDDNRNIIASNQFAQQWLKMSAYDDLKKNNLYTYQHWMAQIVSLPKDNYEIIVPLQKEAQEKALNFLRDNNTSQNQKILGINPGAGKRWNLKKWTIEGFIETAKHFSKKGYTVLLLGGKQDEKEIDVILKEKIPNALSTGTDNTIADFFAKINLCDVVLCGDTMALHAAVGLKKNVVALFGPTSINEIEIYCRGTKIQGKKNCVTCYKQECHLENNCMQTITPKEVIDTIEKYMGVSKNPDVS
ncbi:MAG: glycosyltransferase family 9 protein [Endomicrobium sp.]|jgi:heptosyltransferase-2|nr:glycosyltransferase family 9 protein [Endomicrobium sp.]